MGSQKGSHKGCLNLFYLSNESLEDARHLFPQCNCLIRLFGEKVIISEIVQIGVSVFLLVVSEGHALP